ncbi:MAG: tRNA (N(6)-L-threonylcarbamoyladenosine(37)-C(2))-methylthiotransferase MtaB [Rhodospirillales bacterium]|nr:tRNA (N(6)-L-threonylcarbamoyladenosine(37)-C(2))-methylthiotransferase MtaB [Rhodospirillales bacterium]
MADTRVITLGCRLNAFESEVIRSEAAAAGVADTVIINTCAVTGEAVRQARQAIRRTRRERPHDRIVVTGCAAQLTPEAFAAMPEVDCVIGNAEKLDRKILADEAAAFAVSDISDYHDAATPFVEGFEGRTRAFVQIQQGCDHRCTFCIVPFARGPSRSVPLEQVAAQIRALVEHSYREVVLTGVDICSYGADLADRPRLGDLVRAILAQIPALRRLRLSTIDPAAIDDVLVVAFGEDSRLMPHVHLSLQAMDDTVLKRMRRRHSRADVFAIADRLRRVRPDMVFGADLIAGFPTETPDMFEATFDAVDALNLTYLHVFPYSPRPGTPAARMPQVPAIERRARAARLRQAGADARARFFNDRIGTLTDVLVETGRDARCPYYAPVQLDVPLASGTLLTARIDGADAHGLRGTAIQ